MLTGAHAIIYSTSPEADRAFLKDVLKLPNVDVGDGWLIFGLPPAEVAVHPSEKNDVHELYFICENIEAFNTAMAEHNIATTAVEDQGWGLLSHLTLPGGGKLGVYQPRHARPPVMGIEAPAAAEKASRKAEKKAAKAEKKANKKSKNEKKGDRKAAKGDKKSGKKAGKKSKR